MSALLLPLLLGDVDCFFFNLHCPTVKFELRAVNFWVAPFVLLGGWYLTGFWNIVCLLVFGGCSWSKLSFLGGVLTAVCSGAAFLLPTNI